MKKSFSKFFLELSLLVYYIQVINAFDSNSSDWFYASGSNDNSMKIWHKTSNKSILNILIGSDVRAIRLIKKSQIITGVTQGRLSIYDLYSRSIIRTIQAHTVGSPVINMLIMNASDVVVSGSTDSTIKIWRLNDMSLISQNNIFSAINALEKLNETFLAYSTNEINLIRIFDIISRTIIRVLNQNSNRIIQCLLKLLGDELLASSDSTLIRIWNWKVFTLNRTFQIGAKRMLQINENILWIINATNRISQINLNNNTILNNTPVLTNQYSAFTVLKEDLIALANLINYDIELYDFVEMKIINIIKSNHIENIISLEYLDTNVFEFINQSTTNVIITNIPTTQTVTTSTSLTTSTTAISTTKTSFLDSTYLLQTTKSELETTGILSTTASQISTQSDTTLTTATTSSIIIQTEKSTNSVEMKIQDIFSLNSTKALENITLSELLTHLENKTFKFDLSLPEGALPLSLLVSPKTDIVNCISNCSNNGVCTYNKNEFSCICDQDYGGSKCETDLRPCSSFPCLNYVKCENVRNGKYAYIDFNCTCKSSYYGKRCENKIDLCQNETCSGNGLCKAVNETQIKCECFGRNSFDGEKCEKKSTELAVKQATIKTASYIAIAVLIGLLVFFMIMDFHKYFIMPKNKPKKIKKTINVKTNRKIKKKRHYL